jgi:DtxR family Mn-dependent transcriptional regulator
VTDPLLSLLVAGLLAGVGAVLAWPDRGLIWRWRQAHQMTQRVLIEDTLKYIHESEMRGQHPDAQNIGRALQVPDRQVIEVLSEMGERQLVAMTGDRFQLTPQGRAYAMQVVRAHRLWERYLAEETGFDEDEWHAQAHRQEHLLSREELDDLYARLNNPTHDPHGDPIPTANGKFVPHNGQPLTALAADQTARIVHLEDEPAALYAQLAAEGLHPGMELRVIDVSPQRVRFWSEAREYVLAPIVAANVGVVPLAEPTTLSEGLPAERLSSLKQGEKAWVAGISPTCRGTERRRFLDLGILPGTAVEAELVSPGGDPTAYRVRGTLLALRAEQAQNIHISREKEAVS